MPGKGKKLTFSDLDLLFVQTFSSLSIVIPVLILGHFFEIKTVSRGKFVRHLPLIYSCCHFYEAEKDGNSQNISIGSTAIISS